MRADKNETYDGYFLVLAGAAFQRFMHGVNTYPVCDPITPRCFQLVGLTDERVIEEHSPGHLTARTHSHITSLPLWMD